MFGLFVCVWFVFVCVWFVFGLCSCSFVFGLFGLFGLCSGINRASHSLHLFLQLTPTPDVMIKILFALSLATCALSLRPAHPAVTKGQRLPAVDAATPALKPIRANTTKASLPTLHSATLNVIHVQSRVPDSVIKTDAIVLGCPQETKAALVERKEPSQFDYLLMIINIVLAIEVLYVIFRIPLSDFRRVAHEYKKAMEAGERAWLAVRASGVSDETDASVA